MKQKKKTILEEQQRLNNKLANLFKSLGIKNFRLLSLGNSISSGYSAVRTIKPLLLRNSTLSDIMSSSGIDLDIHHFARAQNNSDEHFFEWLSSNVKETEIYRLNRSDYSGSKTSLPSPGITEAEMDEYYPTQKADEIGLQDAVLDSDSDLANVVIYNGCTGSFLDNITRNGKIIHMLTYGIKRDTRGLEATLKFIQSHNRKNNTNTQVYICGAPDFLGLKLSEVINAKLRKITSMYANAVYVPPVKSKFFYKPLDVSDEIDLEQAQSIFQKMLLLPDIHYDEEEYLKFNNNIIKAISDNYLVVRAMINADREFYNFSAELETENHDMLDNNAYIQNYLGSILISEASRLPNETSMLKFCARLKQYLLDRAPYDFYYIGKKNIKHTLSHTARKKKH